MPDLGRLFLSPHHLHRLADQREHEALATFYAASGPERDEFTHAVPSDDVRRDRQPLEHQDSAQSAIITLSMAWSIRRSS